MKRHGNLFNKITSLDNLYLAHHNARKGKTHLIVQQIEQSLHPEYTKYLGEKLTEKFDREV